MTVQDRVQHIAGVLEEVKPWLEKGGGSVDAETAQEVGVNVRRLLREAVTVSRGILGSSVDERECA